MTIPAFTYIPIIQDAKQCVLQVASLVGLSTKHGDSHTDQGRLYGDISLSGVTGSLTLYSEPYATPGGGDSTKAVATGSGPLGQYFNLAASNTSGITGRALISNCTVSPSQIVLIPTFATDEDVLLEELEILNFPGYDNTYGLASIHARAMQRLMGSELPARFPNLFPGNRGLAGFIPNRNNAQLYDLTQLANPDQLRIAQAALVKSMAAEQSEHLAEWAELAKLARERFRTIMDELALANPQEIQAKEQFQADNNVTVTSFTRG